MIKNKKKNANFGVLLGAAFLMATSAIGPGFLTQTATFTERYGGNFGFVILATIILTFGVQLNIWRIIGVSGMRGQDIANKVVPGLGYFIAALVALGGLAFNIGNVGGAALGLNVLLGIDIKLGTAIAGIVGIIIFLSKDAGPIIDKFTRLLGGLMIILVAYVTVSTNPPVGEAVARTIAPDDINMLIFPIITLLGGTVGGYITFAGGHRLIDAGISGEENLREINKSSLMGIGIASIMRVLLFLAILGVVTKGMGLDPSNPAADAFLHGAGNIGYKFFGMVLTAAGLTSVVGAAYTSVSFLKTLNSTIAKHENYFIIGFIAVSTAIMTFIGQPAKLLVLAGSLNGLILPVTLGTILLASRRKDIVGEYKHPTWLLVFGIIVVILTAYGGWVSLQNIQNLF
ncbi:Mn2+ and Fe2+ transporters of the NRAMP family [Natronincola peptidivorans]|uniref:Mn2+ and Fe2+ transporters of the NRAMP family n=1 Tax=Natronincola peptidivorans TaxID=426128 RepID=A0A1H9ZPJ9_9FIRM|nr:NRAMP family divalent metal transporter [Natronincola peptidivorans]SES82751.1 Mn2+ and Fe2+ transporters of the NRAMP family [Natronincola peptidivorans]